LTARDKTIANFDIESIANATDGFSGSEIEQAVVAALYAAHAQREDLTTEHILTEVEQTRPLSIVMQERIDSLRQWADGRTVACD
jgi:SpoVK/Ycf46/Vps4 family AAA+-type ATPase